jgi:hypothetical protein
MDQQKFVSALRKDYQLFGEALLKIKSERMEAVPFIFNRVQIRLWEMALEDLLAGKPIRWDILKSRQLGSSTWVVLFIFWTCMLNRFRNALIVAHDLASATNLHEMAKFAYAFLPPDMQPLQKTSNRRELYFANPDPKGDKGLDSKIVVDTCDNKDLGAGRTLHLVLLSEIARYESVRDPRIIMTSLNQAVPFVPGTAVFRETTAQGDGYWKDQWEDANNGYRKVFIPWVALEKYRLDVPPSEYFSLSELAKSSYGDEYYVSQLIRTELQNWYPDLVGQFAELDREIMCRLAWRRWAIDKKCEKDKNIFAQEYPLTADEAFVGSGSPVFADESLVEMSHRIKELKVQPQIYAFNGRAYKEHEKDWWEYAFKKADYGPLKVFEEPSEGANYVIGADPSYGISDSDNSAAIVLRCPSLVEVATWNHPIPPDYFAEVLYALGRIYNNGLVGVEVTGPGIGTINHLWHTLYYEHLYYREMAGDRISRTIEDRLGWSTNIATKPIMVTVGKRMVGERLVLFNNDDTIRHFRSYKQLRADKFGAPAGYNDDLVMAALIAIQMAQQTHIPLVSEKKSIPRWSPAWIIEQQRKKSLNRNFGGVSIG